MKGTDISPLDRRCSRRDAESWGLGLWNVETGSVYAFVSGKECCHSGDS